MTADGLTEAREAAGTGQSDGSASRLGSSADHFRYRLGYQPALDGIRALSVLAVIAYHYDYGWARGGFLGVDAFFVLSGFLITTLLVLEFREYDTVRRVAFWLRRARRLLPALLMVLLFVAVYTRTSVATSQRTSVRDDGLASLFYVANWRFIFTKQSYFELFTGSSPLRHMWSLAVEEQFYLVWPLVVLLCMRLGRGRLRVLTTVCVVGTLASIVVMASTYKAADPTRAYFGTDARAHTILIGVLLSLLLLARSPTSHVRRIAPPLGVVAAVAIVIAWTRVTGTSGGYYRGGSALYAVAVAVVIAAALQGGVLGGLLAVAPLAWIGRISYGLYLWHWPIDIWLTPARAGIHGTPLNLFRLGVTFAAATLSYYVVERPVRTRGLRFARAPLRPVAAALAVASVAGVLAVSSAGAAPTPGYLVAIGHPGPCGAPSAAERRQAEAALQPGDQARHVDSTRRVMVVGDSLACSLYPGLSAIGHGAGIRVEQGVVTGCGVVSDETAPTNGEGTMIGTNICHDLVARTQNHVLARLHPDTVVWFSSWERLSMKVGGRVIAAGTPAGDELLLSRMDGAFARLTARGARLVMLTVPPFTDGTALGIQFTSSPERDVQVLHLNGLLRRFAARHPGRVFVVDLAQYVCPRSAPCGPDVDGRRPRPDGAHFSPADSVWAARWVLGELASLRSG